MRAHATASLPVEVRAAEEVDIARAVGAARAVVGEVEVRRLGIAERTYDVEQRLDRIEDAIARHRAKRGR